MRYTLSSVFFTQIILLILLLLMLFPQDWMVFEILRIVCWSLILFYLPWYWIWYLFFSEQDLSAFERFAINFLISITLIIIISYYLYFTSNSISTIKIYLISIVILSFAAILALIRWRNWVPSSLPIDNDIV